MSSLAVRITLIASLSLAFQTTRAQQAFSSIEQARLFQHTPNATNAAVNADGTALPESETSSDDSFGTQVILKSRERLRTIFVTGDVSVFYTNNAALTPSHKMDDAFFVTNAGVNWTPRLAPNLEAQVGGHAGIFRYASMSTLDFEDLGVGAGLFWKPENFCGIGLFARFDFIELLDRHSKEILRDHELTIGGQKVFAIGRNQAFTVGATLTGGIAMPSSVQRQQAGMFFGYSWQITRALETELFYRSAAHFYNRADRTDWNQIVLCNLRYHVSRWADVNAFLSYGRNLSDENSFDYGVFTGGGGLGLTLRF